MGAVLVVTTLVVLLETIIGKRNWTEAFGELFVLSTIWSLLAALFNQVGLSGLANFLAPVEIIAVPIEFPAIMFLADILTGVISGLILLAIGAITYEVVKQVKF